LAWTIGEAVNNASGLGFNGYDENGKAKWDLVTNIRILELEVNIKA
jgi:lysophospholipid acyltransferase 1/2